jgi:hypothetical protein
MSWYSSVSVATGYIMDARGSIPGSNKFFFVFSIASRPALGPTLPPISPEVKRTSHLYAWGKQPRYLLEAALGPEPILRLRRREKFFPLTGIDPQSFCIYVYSFVLHVSSHCHLNNLNNMCCCRRDGRIAFEEKAQLNLFMQSCSIKLGYFTGKKAWRSVDITRFTFRIFNKNNSVMC